MLEAYECRGGLGGDTVTSKCALDFNVSINVAGNKKKGIRSTLPDDYLDTRGESVDLKRCCDCAIEMFASAWLGLFFRR
jgi:hypothetical protein